MSLTLCAVILLAQGVSAQIVFEVDSEPEWNGSFGSTEIDNGNLQLLSDNLEREESWEQSSNLDDSGLCCVEVTKDYVYSGTSVTGGGDFYIRRHSKTDLSVLSRISLDYVNDLEYYNGTLYATSDVEGAYTLPDDLSSKTQFGTSDPNEVVVTDDRIYLMEWTSGDTIVHAYFPSNRSKIWQRYVGDDVDTIVDDHTGDNLGEDLVGAAGEDLFRLEPDGTIEYKTTMYSDGTRELDAKTGAGIQTASLDNGIKFFSPSGVEQWQYQIGDNGSAAGEVLSDKQVFGAWGSEADSITRHRSNGSLQYREATSGSPGEIDVRGRFVYSAGKNESYGGAGSPDLLERFVETYGSGSYVQVFDASSQVTWDRFYTELTLNSSTANATVELADTSSFSSPELVKSSSLSNGGNLLNLNSTYARYARVNYTLKAGGSESQYSPHVDLFNLTAYTDTDDPVTNITGTNVSASPKISSFNVTVDDYDIGSSGIDTSSCEYRIKDGSDPFTSWQTRSCPDGNVTVEINDECSWGNSCTVETRVSDNSGNNDTDNETYIIAEKVDTELKNITSRDVFDAPLDSIVIDVNDTGPAGTTVETIIDNGTVTTVSSKKDRDIVVDSDGSNSSNKVTCDRIGFSACEVTRRVEGPAGNVEYESVKLNILYDACPGALACWQMNMGTGQKLYDYSGNWVTGVRGTNGSAESDDPTWQSSCVSDDCLRFNSGNADYANVSSTPVDYKNLSVSAEIEINAPDSSHDEIIQKPGSFRLAVDQNTGHLMGTVQSSLCGGYCGSDSSTDPAVMDQWVDTGVNVEKVGWRKVAMVWNGTSLTFYIEGLKVEERYFGSTADSVSDPGNNISLGGIAETSPPSASSTFKGKMDNVSIYNSSDVFRGVGYCQGELEGFYYDYLKENTTQRLIDDAEVCQEIGSGLHTWVDQDKNAEACRNTWVPASRVQEDPRAFVDGIDDDYRGEPDPYRSDPSASRPLPAGISPVGTGNYPDEKNITTLGFCLGDDKSEVKVTQVCRTGLCRTNRSVFGADKSANSCALDTDQPQIPLPSEGVKIFDQGENVSFTSEKSIACFNGVFYSEWPVASSNSSSKIVSGRENIVNYNIINIINRRREFRLSLEGSGSKYAQFSNGDDEYITEVPPRSALNIPVVVFPTPQADGKVLTLQAESTTSSYSGQDSTTLQVNSSSKSGGGTRSIPGIGVLHVLAIGLAATLIYLFNTTS